MTSVFPLSQNLYQTNINWSKPMNSSTMESACWELCQKLCLTHDLLLPFHVGSRTTFLAAWVLETWSNIFRVLGKVLFLTHRCCKYGLTFYQPGKMVEKLNKKYHPSCTPAAYYVLPFHYWKVSLKSHVFLYKINYSWINKWLNPFKKKKI